MINISFNKKRKIASQSLLKIYKRSSEGFGTHLFCLVCRQIQNKRKGTNMANLCSFNMCIKGEHHNIEKFYNAMTHKGSVYMGRGACAEIDYKDEGKRAFIYGDCKWSIVSALIDNAIDMRKNPQGWYWGEGIDVSKLEFITLWEACERWELTMEVYSTEPGCCFQEHYMYTDDLIIEDCVDYYEYCIAEYNSKNEAEKDLGFHITDEEWTCDGGFITRGGYESWDFTI